MTGPVTLVPDPQGEPPKDQVKKEEVLLEEEQEQEQDQEEEQEQEEEEEEEAEDDSEGFDASRGLFNSKPVNPDGTIDDGITSGGDGLIGDLPQDN